MKELKFICPSCGQHIQCDLTHAGENVPCPGCAALIRVPLDGSLADVPESQSEGSPFPPVAGDAETVSYTSTKPAGGTEEKKSPAPAENEVATSVSPLTANPTLPTTPNKEPPAIAPVAHTSELHCVCPVCQSELRISVEPERSLGGAAHTARLGGASEHASESPQTSAEHLPMGERDRQIAAARESALHPTTTKPRLDRILGDRSAVPQTSSSSEKK